MPVVIESNNPYLIFVCIKLIQSKLNGIIILKKQKIKIKTNSYRSHLMIFPAFKSPQS
jgi:hypothetical protein